jgi:5-methylcytosine-specific restriction endonuclease McrA
VIPPAEVVAGAPEAPTPAEPSRVVRDEPRRAAEVRPISESQWSLRVTIDGACKADLETLASLLSHKAGSDLAAVLHEAIRCGIEKHGKRKGAVEPSRPGAKRESNPARGTRAIPLAVRREVWKRDGGCCASVGPDGRRCGSRWKLEIDHIDPVALGGTADPSRLRVACRRHNWYYAEQIYGREHMERFRRTGDDAPEGKRGAERSLTRGLFVREPCAIEWGQAGAG